MKKYIVGFVLGLFVATYGIDGLYKFVDGLSGIAKNEIDQIIHN